MGKRVLVVSRGLIHPSLTCRIYLKQLLKSLQGNFTFVFSGALDGLKRLREGNYDAVILYFHEKKISDHALHALIQFAGKGGGVLALHASMASFKTNTKYQELLGGRFTGHGKIEKIDVYTKDAEHELLKEAAGFTIKDELYIHEYDRRNEIVLACENKGQEEPVLWTRRYGSGRVCYFAPGHMPNVFQTEAVRKVIKDALMWVCKSEG
jgi:uncharacterized protein